MTALFIIRHGATKFNKQAGASKEVKSKDLERAWSDVPLTAEGQQEARKAGLELRGKGIKALFSSTLVRAAQTAQIIGPLIGVQPTFLDDLRTWNLGNLMGEQAKDVEPRVMEFVSNPDMPVPGGESFNQFKQRIQRALQHIIQVAQNTRVGIIVHHRVERLIEAWKVAGEPSTFAIDVRTFLEAGESPGSVEEMELNATALAPAGGAGSASPTLGQSIGQPPMGRPQMPVPAAGMPMQPPQPNPMAAMFATMDKIKRAIDLLRQDIPRGYRIDIEVDTMVAGDQQQERADATEFIGAVTKFIETAGMIVMQSPDFAPLAAKMLQWGVRRYRTGRDLESAIDEYADRVSKAAQAGAGQPKGPTPEQSKAQAEQARSQAEIAKAKIDAQSAQANDQREQQLRQQEFAFKQKTHEMEMAMMQMKMQHETQIQAMKMQIEQQRTNAEMTSARLKEEAAQADHRRNQAAAEDDHRRAREVAEFQHRQKMKPKEGAAV